MILEESLVGSPLVQTVWQRLQVTQHPQHPTYLTKMSFDEIIDLTADVFSLRIYKDEKLLKVRVLPDTQPSSINGMSHTWTQHITQHQHSSSGPHTWKCP